MCTTSPGGPDRPEGREGHLITSIYLDADEMEEYLKKLWAKYGEISAPRRVSTSTRPTMRDGSSWPMASCRASPGPWSSRFANRA